MRRRFGHRSLRFRTTMFGAVTLSVVLGLGAFVTYGVLTAAVRSDLSAQNGQVLDALARAIEQGGNPRVLNIPGASIGTGFAIYDLQGNLVNAQSLTVVGGGTRSPATTKGSNPTPSVSIAGAAPDERSSGQPQPIPGTAEMVEVSSLLPFPNSGGSFSSERSVISPDGTALRLMASTSTGLVDRNLHRVSLGMFGVVPLLVLAGTLALRRAVSAALAPVHRITAEAARIAPSNSGDRLHEPDSGDEIAELAVTVNGMLERLDVGLVRQRQFVSDASHELRSPLTVIRGAADLLAMRTDLPTAARSNVSALGRGAARLERILDDLGRLATAGEPLDHVDVDVEALVIDELNLSHTAAVESRVSVSFGTITPAIVFGNAVQLGRALQNMLANAVRHASSQVVVSTEIVERNGRRYAEFAIDDDGPGIAPADRLRVFERFVRLDEGRDRDSGGAGLGLALVAAIAEAHDGTIDCTESRLGGARFALSIPCPSPTCGRTGPDLSTGSVGTRCK